MLKTLLVFLFLLILFFHAFTQQPIIKTIEYINKDRSINLKFPLINYFDKNIERAINKFIQNRILDLDNTNQYKSDPSMFNKSMSNKENAIGGFISLSYAAYFTDKIISIRFKGETMGAYPGYYSDNYTFSLKNGKVLQIDDLILTNATFNIYDTLYNLNKQEMEDAITGVDSNIVDYVRNVIEKSINEKKAVDFYVLNDTIIFFHSPAGFSHAMRCYEMDFNTSYSIQDSRIRFTDTGKFIFLNNDDTGKKKYNVIKSSNWYY